MDIRELVNKEKLRCDNIIIITIIISFIVLFIFFTLIAIMSIIIYPLSSLFLYGIYYVYKGLFKKDKTLIFRILRLIVATFYITLSSFMFWLIFSYPHITPSYVVFFLSIPAFYIGLAAILKGSIINVYSPKYRKLNVLIGIITIIGTILSVYYVEVSFVLSLISVLTLLILNGILRSGLYLSEYGLSLRKREHVRLIFDIMDDLQHIKTQDVVG